MLETESTICKQIGILHFRSMRSSDFSQNLQASLQKGRKAGSPIPPDLQESKNGKRLETFPITSSRVKHQNIQHGPLST